MPTEAKGNDPVPVSVVVVLSLLLLLYTIEMLNVQSGTMFETKQKLRTFAYIWNKSNMMLNVSTSVSTSVIIYIIYNRRLTVKSKLWQIKDVSKS